MTIKTEKVTFTSNNTTVVGILRIPESNQSNLPAIVSVHPVSGSKEQTAGLYAEKLANEGFVTLAYDASHQGESVSAPEYVENPYYRVEDVRAAVDYLTTLDIVDNERIGALGICAGGGYATSATLSDRRIKALGTVVGVNFGRFSRESDVTPDAAIRDLEKIAELRTAEANGSEPYVTQYIPNSPEELAQTGIDEIDVKEAVDYYRTPRGQSENSPNKWSYSGSAALYTFDAFFPAEKLLTQPVQIIAGDVPGAFGSYRDAYDLYNRARSTEKYLHIVKGATHYDLYDQPEQVNEALSKLVPFYNQYL
ncbi:alpha/beta hydrolase [Staphylococcus argenteus]|uniref:alpha/beta hydrolase n=1 Tax=Staphylococcus argenteus TaxID=985002 RepID=UPI001FB9152C|nr:alpha/beta hydrolase [Staphylococcus argenteus]GJF67837.1 alpha/beta hydrolase [Staphylococcus argenteus]GJF82965.1 alpha/beta hydrolase [Staphylococcus argenteus]